MALVTAAVVAVPALCPADKVVRKDGTVTEGKIVAEGPRSVILSVGSGGSLTIPRSQIDKVINDAETRAAGPASREADAAESGTDRAEESTGATYYPIPIMGEIGRDVKAQFLRRALEDAREENPDFVVLYIDSPGGSVAQTREIVGALAEARDLRRVAVVREALSSAAIVAMTCREIYMTPTAVIGGAVPYRIGPDGTPEEVEEKFQSVIRAQFRAAAQMGEHPTLLVESMMDQSKQVVLIEKDGEKRLAESGDGEVLKEKGQILTLTPREATQCGLADGTVGGLEGLGKAMGLHGCHEASRKGWRMMVGQARIARRERQQKLRREALAAQREKVAPEIEELNKQIRQHYDEAELAQKELSMLHDEYERQKDSIHDQYRRQRKRAGALGAVGRVRERERLIEQAKSQREQGLNRLRSSFEPKVRQLKLKISELRQKIDVLQREKKRILAKAGLR